MPHAANQVTRFAARRELEALVGNHVRVDAVHEFRNERHIAPNDGVWWLYLARE